MSKKVYPKSTKWEDMRLLKHKPLYVFGYRDSVRYGERELWLQSYQENCACARAIEKEIENAYVQHSLNEDSAKKIIERFGYDRVNWVLSNTVRQSGEKQRYGIENVVWASRFCIPVDKQWSDKYTVCSHPTLAGVFMGHVRMEWGLLGLYDADNCYADRGDTGYTGRVVAVRSEILRDEYKSPAEQLFYVSGMDGDKVYGRFLKDGEKMRFRRSEIIGAVKLGLIPDWAQEKYAKAVRKERAEKDRETGYEN